MGEWERNLVLASDQANFFECGPSSGQGPAELQTSSSGLQPHSSRGQVELLQAPAGPQRGSSGASSKTQPGSNRAPVGLQRGLHLRPCLALTWRGSMGAPSWTPLESIRERAPEDENRPGTRSTVQSVVNTEDIGSYSPTNAHRGRVGLGGEKSHSLYMRPPPHHLCIYFALSLIL